MDSQDLSENEWVIKCVMRCLNIANEDLIPVMEIVLSKLTVAITRVARNPKNPEYTHYVFESIAVLIRALCLRDPYLTGSFEALLFPLFQDVLQGHVLELSPYIFQVIAQLLEYCPNEAGLGEVYMSLLPQCLSSALWERRGNVPALTQLIHAYLRKPAAASVLEQNLEGIHGVFKKLLSDGMTNSIRGINECAFEILDAVFAHVSTEFLSPYFEQTFDILMQSYCHVCDMSPTKPTQLKHFVKLLTNFFALYTGRYGSGLFFTCLDATTDATTPKGYSLRFIKEVWIPKLLEDLPRRMEAKVQVIGLTKLLCATPVWQSNEAWTCTLVGLVTVLSNSSVNIGNNEIIDISADAPIGYDAQYSKLAFARQPADDPFPRIDPQNFFLRELHSLSTEVGTSSG